MDRNSYNLNTIPLSDGAFIYDVFPCRRDYIGLVAPYWCVPQVLHAVAPDYYEPVRATAGLLMNDQHVECFVLQDSRKFTLSVLAKLPCEFRDDPMVTVSVGHRSIPIYPWRPYVNRLAMVTMARYDAPYLAEWITHHADLGFQHFYVYNHTGERAITAVLQDFGSLATEIVWSGGYAADSAWKEPFLGRDSHCYTQCPQMMHAALKYGAGWDWMGFFDADEFLCPMGTMDILDILAKTEHHLFAEVPWKRSAALEVQGKWFGTSGHKTLPPGSVRANYLRCEAGHTCGTKCFVQPDTVSGTAVHCWDVAGQTARVPDNVLRFNHYRAISTFKNRTGRHFNNDWTNAIEDTSILRITKDLPCHV